MTVMSFKRGDEVTYHGGRGDWKGKIGIIMALENLDGPTGGNALVEGFFERIAYPLLKNLRHVSIQYDPKQQGDTDDDI